MTACTRIWQCQITLPLQLLPATLPLRQLRRKRRRGKSERKRRGKRALLQRTRIAAAAAGRIRSEAARPRETAMRPVERPAAEASLRRRLPMQLMMPVLLPCRLLQVLQQEAQACLAPLLPLAAAHLLCM